MPQISTNPGHFRYPFFSKRQQAVNAEKKKTHSPEIHTPVSHRPEDQPAELAEHQLSYVLASGKFGLGYSSHANGEAKAVQKGRVQDIIAEKFAPIAKILVAGQDHAAVFITLRDKPEQKFCFWAVQLHITNLVNYQQGRSQVDPPAAL